VPKPKHTDTSKGMLLPGSLGSLHPSAVLSSHGVLLMVLLVRLLARLTKQKELNKPFPYTQYVGTSTQPSSASP
jgi:hypothetical protein